MKFKKLTVIFMSLGLIFSEMAFAGRFGGGRSRGMQRNISTTQYSNKSYNNNYNNSARQAYSTPHQNTVEQPRRSGMGAGTAAMLGAAAGAAGGYMLGKNSSENNNNPAYKNENASGASVQEERSVASSNNAAAESSRIPWGIIVILLALLGVGLMFFRRKTNNNSFINQKNIPSNNHNDKFAGFNLPKFKRQAPEAAIGGAHHYSNNNSTHGGNTADSAPIDYANADRMPDGIETIYFLRQVKGMFLHIQSMNNPENLTEVAKYLTPELYQELQAEITANTIIADFSNLECKVVKCEQLENTIIASVQFSGMVSEDPTQKPEPFNEIWNFLKPDIKINKWLVAGIQHTPSAT